MDNQQNINSKIINLTRIRGPILPIHASKETGQSLILTGAFLSSLISDKLLKVSSLKVGGSPLYFIPGQEAQLENFVKFLNHKEREAYTMIKEKKVLKDDDLTPDIRVAIRDIKDFANSFSLNSQPNVIFWRFFSLTDEQLENEMSRFRMIPEAQKESAPEKKPEIKSEVKPAEAIQVKVEEAKKEEKIEPKKESEEKKLEIFEKIEEKKEKPRKPRAKPQPNKFLNEIKALLTAKNLELVRIEKSEKKELTLIAKQDGKEMLILALDKKRLDESDLIKAFRKASALKLPYLILGRGEMPKKFKEIMEASKNIERIERI